VARRSLKWLLLLMPEPGCFPESVFTAGERGDEAEVRREGWTLCQAGGMTPQVLYDAVVAFGRKDPIFQDALMGLAHRYLWGMDPPELTALRVGPKQVPLQNPYTNAALIPYAFALSDYLPYAGYCRYYLREHFVKKMPDMIFTYVYWGGIIPAMLEAVRRAEARHGLEAVAQAEADWVRWVTEEAEKNPERPKEKVCPLPPRAFLGAIEGYET
jgi:hypothetical protein